MNNEHALFAVTVTVMTVGWLGERGGDIISSFLFHVRGRDLFSCIIRTVFNTLLAFRNMSWLRLCIKNRRFRSVTENCHMCVQIYLLSCLSKLCFLGSCCLLKCIAEKFMKAKEWLNLWLFNGTRLNEDTQTRTYVWVSSDISVYEHRLMFININQCNIAHACIGRTWHRACARCSCVCLTASVGGTNGPLWISVFVAGIKMEK